jgi:DNA-binding protein HU-beta
VIAEVTPRFYRQRRPGVRARGKRNGNGPWPSTRRGAPVNKAQLVEELSSRFPGGKKEAQHALEQVIDVIERALVAGEKVAITGFGSFEKIERAARTARNPRTGATVKVKKSAVPKFRPGAELKAVVSGARKLPKVAAATAGAAVGTAGRAVASGRRATGTAASVPTQATRTSGTGPATARTTATTAAGTAAKRTAVKKAAAKKTATTSATEKTATKKAATTRTAAKKTATTKTATKSATTAASKRTAAKA